MFESVKYLIRINGSKIEESLVNSINCSTFNNTVYCCYIKIKQANRKSDSNYCELVYNRCIM